MKVIEKYFLLPPDTGLQYHASTILPEGSIAFFGGTKEGHPDTHIYLAGPGGCRMLPKKDNLPRWNPVLFSDSGLLYLFYKKGETVHNWQTAFCTSCDQGLSWGEEIDLPNCDNIPQGPVKNKPVLLSNGTWLAGTSLETPKYWSSFAALSHSKGRSWELRPLPLQYSDQKSRPQRVWDGLKNDALWESNIQTAFQWEGIIQPSPWESSPGQCHMMCRSTYGRIYRSDSSDYGLHWSQAYPTLLENNNSGIDLVHCQGVLYLAHNPIADNWGRRSPLRISLSLDNGLSWQKGLDLETEEGEFSYPAITACGNILHISYTHNRKNIVYTAIEV